MAALEVVHRRIVQAGLGEACLELHSTKANKRAVMKELAASLDASLQSVAAPTISTQRLPQVRNTLSKYVTAVHDPFGTLAISPYRAYGELGRVLNAPRASYSGTADKVTLDQLNQAVRDLQDLTATSAPIGIPSEPPGVIVRGLFIQRMIWRTLDLSPTHCQNKLRQFSVVQRSPVKSLDFLNCEHFKTSTPLSQ